MAGFVERGKRKERLRRKDFLRRFAKSYKKAPVAVRIQVTVVLILAAALICGLVVSIYSIAKTISSGIFLAYQKGAAVQIEGAGEEKTLSIRVYRAEVNDRVRNREELVKIYCKRHKIGQYTELALAMIQQESNGEGNDIMQASACGYNKNPPIDDPEESISCGIQYLRDCLKLAKVRHAADIKRINLAIQGYNYGQGYIKWAKKSEDRGYTPENAAAFSQKMKSKLSVGIYGDPDYVPHVMQYYRDTGKVREIHAN